MWSVSRVVDSGASGVAFSSDAESTVTLMAPCCWDTDRWVVWTSELHKPLIVWLLHTCTCIPVTVWNSPSQRLSGGVTKTRTSPAPSFITTPTWQRAQSVTSCVTAWLFLVNSSNLVQVNNFTSVSVRKTFKLVLWFLAWKRRPDRRWGRSSKTSTNWEPA